MASSRRASRYLVMTLVVVLAIPALAPAAIAKDRRRNEFIRHRVETLINRDRSRHGQPRLRASGPLQRHARRHAKDMARARVLYHDPRLAHEVPASARMWGENIGRSTSRYSPRDVQRLFMSSSAHRSNVLQRQWTHMGIGVAKRGGYTYITQRYYKR